MMAWRNNAKLPGILKWRLPPPENPHGVPREVQKQLAQENLTSDPALWNRRLAELLSAYEKNGG
jgi:hypothetical protein